VLSEITTFFGELLRALPPLLPRFVAAWILSAALLILGFGAVKNRVRNLVTRMDNEFASGRAACATAFLEPQP
jgi:cytochrome c-type biogenesis protein CcmH/NrfF